MNNRTCPHCNYKYSKIEHFKRLLHKFAYSKWSCINCEGSFKIDFKRRLFVAITFGLWNSSPIIVYNYFTLDWYWWILYALAYPLGMVFIFSLDKFVSYNKND